MATLRWAEMGGKSLPKSATSFGYRSADQTYRYSDQKLTREEALKGMTIDGKPKYRETIIA